MSSSKGAVMHPWIHVCSTQVNLWLAKQNNHHPAPEQRFLWLLWGKIGNTFYHHPETQLRLLLSRMRKQTYIGSLEPANVHICESSRQHSTAGLICTTSVCLHRQPKRPLKSCPSTPCLKYETVSETFRTQEKNPKSTRVQVSLLTFQVCRPSS